MSGKLTLISSVTASGSASVEFTSGIDSTYDEYQLWFVDMHPATNGANLTVDFSIGGTFGSTTKTTTFFMAYHNEPGTDSGLTYVSSRDLAQSTSAQEIAFNIGNVADQCASGGLSLFSPSSTSKVKHFYSRVQGYHKQEGANGEYTEDVYAAGYCNTTSAIDGVKFVFSSGNIDTGNIYLYGVS
jgi:hypothetical protein